MGCPQHVRPDTLSATSSVQAPRAAWQRHGGLVHALPMTAVAVTTAATTRNSLCKPGNMSKIATAPSVQPQDCKPAGTSPLKWPTVIEIGSAGLIEPYSCIVHSQ